MFQLSEAHIHEAGLLDHQSELNHFPRPQSYGISTSKAKSKMQTMVTLSKDSPKQNKTISGGK